MSALAIYRPKRFLRLLIADSQNISRDPILLFVTVMSFVPYVLLYFFEGPLNGAGVAHLGVESLSFYVTGPVVIMPAFLLGWVTGFLLLEDRDDGPLLAMEATPVGKNGFLLYRVSVTWAVCFAVAFIGARLLLAELGWVTSVYMAFLVAIEAIIVAFVLLAIARNKVEGLALSKLINIGALLPLFAIFPSGLRFIGGVFPTFWIGEFLGLSTGRPMNYLMAALLGFVVHGIWLFAMMAIIRRRIG